MKQGYLESIRRDVKRSPVVFLFLMIIFILLVEDSCKRLRTPEVIVVPAIEGSIFV